MQMPLSVNDRNTANELTISLINLFIRRQLQRQFLLPDDRSAFDTYLHKQEVALLDTVGEV